jgi:hypothetical protein
VAPVEHHVCDLLGIPYNTYGIVSNTFDILNELLVDMEIQRKHDNLKSGKKYNPSKYQYTDNKNQEESKMIKLYNYLIENDKFSIISKMIDDNVDHCSVVEQHFINYLLVKYFVNDWVNNDIIVNSFKIPVSLITTEESRLRKCIGITTFKQVEIIPSDVIQKHKIKKDIGIEYGLIFLEEQEFYKKI